MTTSPHVALTFSDLDSKTLEQIDRRSLGTPAEMIQSSLMSYRLMVVNTVRQELLKKPISTATELLNLTNEASRLLLPKWTRLVSPSVITSYFRAYQDVGAGNVPPETIYALAEQHAERLGVYFNETSQEALAQGFNALVNQKVPARAAAEQALQAYGLTPRQMSGAVSLKAPEKVLSVSPRALKARFQEYIGKSLRSRFKIFADQEIHNLDQQAKQTAWMWMQAHGGLTANAEKVWLTARDERVCTVCGPMNGVHVGIQEKYELPNGVVLWVPGAHTNCRCVARVVDLPEIQKDLKGPELKEFNEDHPRGYHGRFGTKARTRTIFKPIEPDVIEHDVIETTPAVGVPAPARVVAPSAFTRVAAPVAAPVSAAAPAPTAVAAPVQMSAAAPSVSAPAPGVAAAPVVTAVQVEAPQKKAVRSLIDYDEIKDLDQPFYMVSTNDDDFYQLDKDTFSSDRDQVVRHAADLRSALISQTVEDWSPTEVFHYPMPGRSGDAEIRMHQNEFRNILETIAEHDTSTPPDDPPIDIELFDPGSDYGSAPIETTAMSAMDMAHLFGIDPSEFHVHVLEVDQIHTPGVGRGDSYKTTIASDPRDYYDISGKYIREQMGENEPNTATPNSVDIYRAAPHDPAHGVMEGNEVTWIDVKDD